MDWVLVVFLGLNLLATVGLYFRRDGGDTTGTDELWQVVTDLSRRVHTLEAQQVQGSPPPRRFEMMHDEF